RREKAGPKSHAIKLYQKRKSGVLEGKKLPENFRCKPVSFDTLAEDALNYSKTHKRSHRSDKWRMAALRKTFGSLAAESLTPLEFERWLTHQAAQNEWKPATVNRYKALISLIYRLGIDNRKVKENPARLIRRRPENN